MKSSTHRHRELAQARHACFVIQRNFGNHAFAPDPQLKSAIDEAEKRGWATWVAPGRCALTDDGVKVGLTYTGVTT